METVKSTIGDLTKTRAIKKLYTRSGYASDNTKIKYSETWLMRIICPTHQHRYILKPCRNVHTHASTYVHDIATTTEKSYGWFESKQRSKQIV